MLGCCATGKVSGGSCDGGTTAEMDELAGTAGFEKAEMEVDEWGMFTFSVARRNETSPLTRLLWHRWIERSVARWQMAAAIIKSIKGRSVRSSKALGARFGLSVLFLLLYVLVQLVHRPPESACRRSSSPGNVRFLSSRG